MRAAGLEGDKTTSNVVQFLHDSYVDTRGDYLQYISLLFVFHIHIKI